MGLPNINMEKINTPVHNKTKRRTTLRRTLVYSLYNEVVDQILDSRKRYGDPAKLIHKLRDRFEIYKLPPEELDEYIQTRQPIPLGESVVDVLMLNGCILKLGQEDADFLYEEITRITHVYSYVIIIPADQKMDNISPDISLLKMAEEQTEEALRFILTQNIPFRFNNQLTDYYSSHLLRYLENRFNIGENRDSKLPSIVLARVW